ncbi:hypothetical protein [Haloarchaeobius sp. DFWS5]|uniref:hypothetical protein n=1 Tax=Haloarchaeobius sp. DFWS5 TaxID=3446114 RepID=UPI003EB72A14
MSDGNRTQRRTVLKRLGAAGATLLAGGVGSAGAAPECSPYECPGQYPQYPLESHDSDTATSFPGDYETSHDTVVRVSEAQATGGNTDTWQMWVTTSSFVSTKATADHPLSGYIDYIRGQETVCEYTESSDIVFQQNVLDGWLGAKGFTDGDDTYGWDDFAFDTVEYGAGFVPYVGTGQATWSYLDKVATGVSENFDSTDSITRQWFYDDGEENPLPDGPWKSKATTYTKYRADMNQSSEMEVTVKNEPAVYDTAGETNTSVTVTVEAPETQPSSLKPLSDEKLAEMGVRRVDKDTIRRNPRIAQRLTRRNREHVVENDGDVFLTRRTKF